MTQLHSIYKELRILKSLLKKTTNQLWSIRFSLTESYEKGMKETDFIPRRLLKMREEEQLNFERYTHQLNNIIANCFNKDLIVFNSPEDVKVTFRIRRTIQYMKNAFTSEPRLIQTLDKLNRALPDQKLRLV